MEILYTADLSHEGNDCYIHESVSLVKAFDMYTIITAIRYTGHYTAKHFYIQEEVFDNFDEAFLHFQLARDKA